MADVRDDAAPVDDDPAAPVTRSKPVRRTGVPWWLPWGLLVLVVAVLLAVGARPQHPLSLGDRADRVAQTIQCPQCTQEGVSVATSDAPVSQEARVLIRQQLQAGQTPDQIRQFFVNKYGPQILLTPKRSGFDALVWMLPVAALVLGAGGLGFAFLRWRRQVPDEVTDEDRAVVAAALAESRGSSGAGSPEDGHA